MCLSCSSQPCSGCTNIRRRKSRRAAKNCNAARKHKSSTWKSQVNPHFLFNILNNLYGLTYSKSDLAPQMVLGLSDTMRYLIYETEQKLVPVEKELNFIRNYIDLEKMRISHPENIRLLVNMVRQTGFIPLCCCFLLWKTVLNTEPLAGKMKDGWKWIYGMRKSGSFLFARTVTGKIKKPGNKKYRGLGWSM